MQFTIEKMYFTIRKINSMHFTVEKMRFTIGAVAILAVQAISPADKIRRRAGPGRRFPAASIDVLITRSVYPIAAEGGQDCFVLDPPWRWASKSFRLMES